ncbi:hypothetical protein [Ectobacillus funiculus]|uniref:Uncharacterized protein n=1 Tax=Ectobacillus funiculus TaxID=137993 RepID=A0ABV5WIU0_9BACI
MFLINKRDKQVILDYSLIYDIDSALHLDFYARGLCIEPEVLFKQPSHFTQVSYGLITTNQREHEIYETNLRKNLKSFDFVADLSRRMVKSVFHVHKICRCIEKMPFNQKMQIYDQLFREVGYMFAFKRFSDLLNPEYFSKYKQDEFLEVCRKVRETSHLVKLNTAIERLREETTDERIVHFIKYYGFLDGFSICPTELETIEGVLHRLSTSNCTKRIKRKLGETPTDFGLLLFRRIGWYEEMRHYYQLRALRIFRQAILIFGLDLYETSYQEFQTYIQERSNAIDNYPTS